MSPADARPAPCRDALEAAATSLQAGEAFQRLGRLDAAAEAYASGLRIHPDDPGLRLRLASVDAAAGRLDRAEAGFAAVLEREPGNVWAWVGAADVLSHQGRPRESEALLVRAQAAVGDHEQVLDRLARWALADGRLDTALDAFTRALACVSAELERHPGQADLVALQAQLRTDAALVRARLAQRAGNKAAVLRIVRALAAAAPGPKLRQDLAALLFDTEHPDAAADAIALLDPVAVEALDGRVLRALSLWRVRRGEMDRAARLLRHPAIGGDPAALLQVAIGLTDAYAPGLAAEAWAQLARVAPDPEPALCGLVDVLLARSRHDEALAEVEAGLKRRPGSLALLNRRAHLSLEVGDARTARQMWSDVLVRDPGDRYAHRGLLWALSALGLHAEARRHAAGLPEPIRSDPGVRAAAVQSEVRDDPAAATGLRRCVGIDPALAATLMAGRAAEPIPHALWRMYHATRSGAYLDALEAVHDPVGLAGLSRMAALFINQQENPSTRTCRAYLLQLIRRGYHPLALRYALARCPEPQITTFLAVLCREAALEARLLDGWAARPGPAFQGTRPEQLMSLRVLARSLRAGHPLPPDLPAPPTTPRARHDPARFERMAVLCRALRPAAARAPGRRPRVALCISGQLRGFRDAFPPLRRLLDAQADTDVFVHTWARVGGSLGGQDSFERFFPPACRDLLPPGVWHREAFGRAFPAASRLLLAEQHVDAGALERVYGTAQVVVEDEAAFEARHRHMTWLHLLGNWNQLKQFYKLSACNALAGEHARRTGAPYDLVIRVRPDLQVTHLVLHEALERCADGRTIGSHYALRDGFGDQLGVGMPAAMDAYAAIWPFMAARGAVSYLPGLHGYGDYLLGRHLFGLGLNPVVLEGARVQGVLSASLPRGPVLEALRQDRPAALAAGLPGPVLDAFEAAFKAA